MDPESRIWLLAIGAWINSALYLAGVFVAGQIAHNTVAWAFALATAGISFLSYCCQMSEKCPRETSVAITLISVASGFIAGIALLI